MARKTISGWLLDIVVVFDIPLPDDGTILSRRCTMTSHIFARVELHEHANGTKPNYEVLKANMARWKFSHELWDGYRCELLPTGTYVRTEPATLDHALDCAKIAADMTGFKNEGLVTSPEGFRKFGLRVRPEGTLLRSLRQARLARRVENSGPVLSGALREVMKKRLHP